MKRIKRRVYELIVEPPEGDVLAHIVHVGILILIAVTVIAGILETVPALRVRYAGRFDVLETFSVIVFTVEYALRLWSCTEDPRFAGVLRGRLLCATRPLTLIDLVAILPFYLQVLGPGIDLRFVRVLRLLRLLRLFRIEGLRRAFVTMGDIVVGKRYEFAISVATVIVVLVLASCSMYLLEHGEKNTPFTSVPASMWWGMVTITTIGYGDMVPATAAGRAVGMFIAFLGVLTLALPVAILSSGFTEAIARRAPPPAEAVGAPTGPASAAAPQASEVATPVHLSEAQLEWLAQRVATLLRTPPTGPG